MKIKRLQDIADRVKVSKTAVSKVLNNKPIRISDEKRQKILALAKQSDYRVNIIARSLSEKKTKSIGIVIPDMSTLFYPSLIKSIETIVYSHGYQIIICNTYDNPSLERQHIEDLQNRLVDGYVIAPVSGRENIDLLKSINKGNQSLILLDRYFPGTGIPFVVTDNYEGAKKGIRVLVKEKVNKIFYIGDKVRNQSLDDRLEGVRQETLRKHIKFTNKDVFFSSTSREEVRQLCTRLFKMNGKGYGIFLESNRSLMGLLDAAKDTGLDIPDDARVVGFDEFEPVMQCWDDINSLHMLKGPVPFIKQDIEKMGNLVSDYLITSFAGKSRRKWQIKIPAEVLFQNGRRKGAENAGAADN